MKVIDCYKRAVSFLPEDIEDNPDMKKYMVNWCNQLLADTMDVENSYRIANGLPRLTEPLTVTYEEDEIPYNEKLVSQAFPYGMARWIFLEDEKVGLAREYYAYYVSATQAATPVIVGEVKDIYC